MPVDLFGELYSVLVGIKDMETASVKRKTKWRSFNVGLEEAQDSERACSFGCSGFFFRFLDSNLCCINANDLKALLRQPDGIVASAAADLQRSTGMDRQRGHGLNQVEVGLANVPRCGAFFIRLGEMIFDAHNVILRGHRRLYLR